MVRRKDQITKDGRKRKTEIQIDEAHVRYVYIIGVECVMFPSNIVVEKISALQNCAEV